MRILDHSQYKKFLDCPRKWYNTYVSMVEPIPTKPQNDSALTLGSLVHAGLEKVLTERRVYIDPDVIGKENPTPECLAEAIHLLTAYAREMVTDPFVISRIEHTLLFPLYDKLTLCAKVDEYFELEHSIDMPSGHGEYITLDPGVWIREHKTKAQSISYDKFATRWTYDRQVDFQCACLSEYLNGSPVNGVLINVIEKPKQHIPKRKCKGCAQTLPFVTYAPVNHVSNHYTCSLCLHLQILQPIKPEQLQLKEPTFYRLYTRRSDERVDCMVADAIRIGLRMDRMEAEGIYSEPPRMTEGACSHSIFGPCEFLPLCITEDGDMLNPLSHGKYREANTKEYMGLTKAQLGKPESEDI